MKCQICNNENPENTKFCAFCGNDLIKQQSPNLNNNGIVCPKCNNIIDDDDAFCGSCGFNLQESVQEQKQDLKCPNCNNIINDDDDFCGNCGFKLSEIKNNLKTDKDFTYQDNNIDKKNALNEKTPIITGTTDPDKEKTPEITEEVELKKEIPVKDKSNKKTKTKKTSEKTEDFETNPYLKEQPDINDFSPSKKTGKKNLIIIIVIITILIATVLVYYKTVVIPNREEESAWEYVKELPSEDILIDFITTYDNGKHYEEAKSMLEDISDWNEAISKKTISSVKGYIINHPSGININEAHKLYNDLKESEDYEKKILLLNKKRNELSKIINTMYYAIEMDAFDANDFFATNVNNYYGLKNINPTKINEIYMQYKKEYTETEYDITTGNEVTILDKNYGLYFTCILKCYRKSKRKYEYLETINEVVFDPDNKIISFEETDVLKDEYKSSPY